MRQGSNNGINQQLHYRLGRKEQAHFNSLAHKFVVPLFQFAIIGLVLCGHVLGVQFNVLSRQLNDDDVEVTLTFGTEGGVLDRSGCIVAVAGTRLLHGRRRCVYRQRGAGITVERRIRMPYVVQELGYDGHCEKRTCKC